ncbi:unnamed protein product [Adineta steineri]|uniref:Uncharacterized protein n=1 Tax=Adineta steineri TaxID=433720 RepID=A0A819ECD9_9BILA|nr:unnamed protein product [Adineta steineri]CAF3847537.1 unnamed protein product [Adineta steineri]
MIYVLAIACQCFIIIESIHFNGGTIRWEPVDPQTNSSTVVISIIQSYSWSYPTIKCANDVPITTSGRSSANTNLTCVADCSTDGGYSVNPVNILTDCVSASSSLGMMTSERSVNATLLAGAHFYISYRGSAWRAVDSPQQNNLYWSVVCFIDLRLRPDGIINTPPEANVVSPQYAIVNRTTQIQIPVSDVNAGDDLRCRWSVYVPGHRRRRQSNVNENLYDQSAHHMYRKIRADGEIPHIRKKRSCSSACDFLCFCSSTPCLSAPTCMLSICFNAQGCRIVTAPTTAQNTTTLETPGTLPITSSYPIRQPIDECGGICYPNTVPNSTTLSNCTLTFTGLIPNTWYAVSIQVEDFIDSTSMTPMSSVPVQFLIYVMPTPDCSITPIIIPLNGCLEVTAGVMKSFNIFVINKCNPFLSNVSDIVVSAGITGMEVIQRHHQPLVLHPPRQPRAPQQLQQPLLLKHQHRLRLLQLRRHPPQLRHQQLQLRQQRRQHQARQLPPQQQQRLQSPRQQQRRQRAQVKYPRMLG